MVEFHQYINQYYLINIVRYWYIPLYSLNELDVVLKHSTTYQASRFIEQWIVFK